MTLKTKLISAIVAFVMVASLMMVGILASPTITMQMGGNVSFTATDLQVTISDGVLANGTLEDSANKMQGVKIDAYNDGATELATWTNLNLTFNESGEDMTITFTITNNSTVDDVQATVTVTVNQGTAVNATVSVTTPTTSPTVISKNNGSQQFVVTFHVNDRNNPASITGFEIDIDLEKYVPPPYERVDAEGNPDENGDYILFGYYPQSAIESSVEIVDTGTQDSRGYYLGSDGEYYAQAEDGNYYKVERLRWRILDDTYGDGTALIVCDVIVDQVAYQSNYTQSGNYYYATDGSNILIDNDATVGEGVDSSHQVYANNYKHSELREYLTGTFYDTAFNDNEKASIVLTEVDNSLASTSNNGGQYVCENTNDYVFALSYVEAGNTDRNFKPTSYAEANGASSTGYGWLRSPGDYDSGLIAFVVEFGYYGDNSVDYGISGVVPALQIQLA